MPKKRIPVKPNTTSIVTSEFQTIVSKHLNIHLKFSLKYKYRSHNLKFQEK